MIYKLKEERDGFIEGVYKDSMGDLNSFFGIKWTFSKPNLVIVENRKEIDKLKNMKTERWVVGWSENKTIYILDRNNFEKESSHKYITEEYIALIKHEMSHAFFSVLSNCIQRPIWFNEGVAIYTSGQNKFKRPILKFEKFLDFYENGGKEVYSESGFAVELLVKKFGKKKLLNLISKLDTAGNKADFSKLFKKIYGFSPTYKEFNFLLKK